MLIFEDPDRFVLKASIFENFNTFDPQILLKIEPVTKLAGETSGGPT